MKGIFNLNWANVQSAIVYGLLMAGFVFSLSVIQHVVDANTIFGLDWTAIVDRGVVETLPVLVAVISLFKNALTTDKGRFLGVTEVIPDKK